ncbi:aspartyl protease family protein 2-like, partial [Typha angustifolia]|uniref:aspartyl protease family protein 2-like n=1 Tax=Typha angustifolia TaxID=59011 RepID=UPI003C2D75B5
PHPTSSSLASSSSLLLVSNAAAKPIEYQTLVVSPLQKPSSLAGDDDLLAGTLAESAEDAATSYLHLRVAHRDSLLSSNSKATADEILRLRLDRDAARVSRLHGSLAAATGSNATGHHHRGGFSSAVVSGLAQGSGEYFTRIGIGTPPSSAYMVLDTGSDVVWIQCAPCRRCYTQSDPVFDPRRSRSYSSVTCDAPLCRRLEASGGCNVRTKSCLYEVSYGDGSITTGDFSTETLTFSGGARVGRIALGCGHDNEGLFVAAAGLLGLGRGRLSFPSQAGRRFGRRFSYCLVDRTSSPSTSRSSSVVFGDSALPASGIAYTPMVRNPKMETFYYVEMTAISVGGTRVPGVAASNLKLDPATGKGGVIIDSGTSVTRLTKAAYAAVRDAFKSGAADLRAAAGGFSLFDTCYDLSGRTEVKVPTVVMHFAGGAQVALPAENYLIPVDTKGTFCFAFAGTDSGVSIIGNIQQQGFRVVFDGDKEKLAFVPKGC